MSKRPFLWSAAFFCAGLLLSAPDLSWSCWALCGFTTLAGSIALCWFASSEITSRAAASSLAIGFLCAGRTAILVTGIEEPFDISTLLRRHTAAFEQGVALSGKLAAPPAQGAAGTDLLVDSQCVRLGRISHPVRGRLRLRVAPGSDGKPPVIAAARGDEVEVFTRLFLPRAPGNPGAFDHGRYLKARGIDAAGSVKSAKLVRPGRTSPPPLTLALMRRIDGIRATILSRIERSFASVGNAPRTAPICAALLLGDRSGLSSGDEARLAEAGLSHLLAVSGFNVAVLAAILHFLARGAGASRRMAATIIIPALFFYLLLNRDESSVVRAVVMAVTVLGGALLWRKSNPVNALGLAAVIILAVFPAQIHDAGFQLTFAATLSLIVITPRLLAPEGRQRRQSRSRPARWLRVALVVSLVAALGTLPLTLLHFNRVTPGAIPANLVAGPLMAAAFVGAGVIAATAPISERLTRAAVHATILLVETTFLIADMICSVPWMTYRRITPGPAPIFLYYGALLWVVAGGSAASELRWKRWFRVLALGACALFLMLPLDARKPPGGLKLTAIDVGQGDAILVETSGGTRLLIDAGGTARGDFDVGERVVAPALWDLGIGRIDFLAVTHPDADHAGGAAAVAAGFRPSQIWLPTGASGWPPRRAITRLRQKARESGIPLKELAAGDVRCLRGACVRVLHPPRLAVPGTPLNERSLVLSISSRAGRALLAADAGADTEALLAKELTRSEYLKVGHHGSRTSSTPGFLGQVRPRIAIISCGARNRFGHPDRGVVARLVRFHARVCRTDQHGAITVELLAHPRRATLIDSACLFSREGKASHLPGEERARNETEDQDDEGGNRHEDPARGKPP